jgi:hypothetical protein
MGWEVLIFFTLYYDDLSGNLYFSCSFVIQTFRNYKMLVETCHKPRPSAAIHYTGHLLHVQLQSSWSSFWQFNWNQIFFIVGDLEQIKHTKLCWTMSSETWLKKPRRGWKDNFKTDLRKAGERYFDLRKMKEHRLNKIMYWRTSYTVNDTMSATMRYDMHGRKNTKYNILKRKS